MRVLVIANAFAYPGGPPHEGIFILRQIQALQKLGWHVRVIRFVPWGPPGFKRWRKYRVVPDRYENAGIEVAVTRVFLLPRFGLVQSIGMQTHRFVRTQIRAFDPHVLHAHQIVPTGLMGIGHGYPLIVTAHGSDTYSYPYRTVALLNAAKLVARTANKTVAVSNFIADHARRLGARNVEVVFNGANEDIFTSGSRAAARAKLSLAADRKVIAFVGRLEEQKGIFELVGAIKRLGDLRPFLLIAGTGEKQNQMLDRLREARIDYRYCGVVHNDDVASFYKAADTVSLPSYGEGLPTVVCEAMLAGRVVVATAVGGIPEIVTDGVNGYLVPPRDTVALADALRRALTDADRERMEQRAEQFARANLTWAINALAYDRIYREVIAGAKGAQHITALSEDKAAGK